MEERMKLVYLVTFFVYMFGVGNAVDFDENYYSYKPKQKNINVEQLLNDIKPTVKTLDLSGCDAVDDNFIRTLSLNKKSEGILNIDLRGTKVTKLSLEYILKSKILGTRRDLPQISGRYDMPSSEIYLDIRDTSIDIKEAKKYFENPISDIQLRYGIFVGHDVFKKTANDEIGIKLLTFNQEEELPYIGDLNIKNPWDIYDSAKKVKDKNQKVKILLEAFKSDNATDECKGWASHDIADIYAEFGDMEIAKKYYRLALDNGDKDCKEVTKRDIKNHGLSKHFPEI